MPNKAKVTELRRHLAQGLQRQLLHGALLVLSDRDNPVRAHLFAAALRELFGLTLETLAPDEEIKSCEWYEQAENTSGPTRRQRAIYAMRGGLPDDYLREELDIDPSALHADIGKAFSELNKRTHVRPDTQLRKTDEIEAFADEQVAALLGVFEEMDRLRGRLARAIEVSLQDEAIEGLMRETIGSLDEISGHYSIESVDVSNTKVVGIDANFVRYHVSGTVDVQLNWGSRSDGASMEISFPFECESAAPVDDPKDFDGEMTLPSVDTSSWFGNDIDYE
jgi:hypothetical protein